MKINTSGKKRTPEGRRIKEYETWIGIRQRCNNVNSKDYPRYGSRGIKVCERWDKSYWYFIADMGPAPTPAYSIDRIDHNKDYSPNNCRWATPAQQRRNQRRSKLTIEDVIKIRAMYTGEYGQQPIIAKQFGVSANLIWAIVNHKKWKI